MFALQQAEDALQMQLLISGVKTQRVRNWWQPQAVDAAYGCFLAYDANHSRVLHLNFDSISASKPSHYTRKKVYGMGPSMEIEYANQAAGTAQDWRMQTLRIYIQTPDGTVGTKEFNFANNVLTGTKALVYHYDHLGSIVDVSPHGDSSGNVAQDAVSKPCKYSYDAWGQRTKIEEQTQAPTTTSAGGVNDLAKRGYTGHEMLDELGFVHMNGRVYDPLLGRFLSADIWVPSADDLQSYNRYSYCRNAPLNTTDPSGFITTADRRKQEDANRQQQAEDDVRNRYSLSQILFLGENFSREIRHARAAASASYQASVAAIDADPALMPFAERVDKVDTSLVDGVPKQSVNPTPVAPNSGVGAPGTLEGFIPIWGSGRAAVDDFQNGKWGWGTFNAGMAVSDVFLVKAAATMAGKGLWKAGSATWGATRKWLGKRGYAEAGQHVHHGIVAQEIYRGTAWEKVFNQPWNLKPLEPPPGITMNRWHQMVEGKWPGLNWAERWWYGTPDWFRFTQISVTGDVVNTFGKEGDEKP